MLRENTNWQDLENSLLWWPKKKKKGDKCAVKHFKE